MLSFSRSLLSIVLLGFGDEEGVLQSLEGSSESNTARRSLANASTNELQSEQESLEDFIRRAYGTQSLLELKSSSWSGDTQNLRGLLLDVIERRKKQLTITSFGGSSSAFKTTYAHVLGSLLTALLKRLKVPNYELVVQIRNPSAGSSSTVWGAVCMETLVPSDTDILLWEFGINDYSLTKHYGILAHQKALELFIRRARSLNQMLVIGFVSLWVSNAAVDCWPKCTDIMFQSVLMRTRWYKNSAGVFAINFNRLLPAWGMRGVPEAEFLRVPRSVATRNKHHDTESNTPFRDRHHPNAVGYTAIGVALYHRFVQDLLPVKPVVTSNAQSNNRAQCECWCASNSSVRHHQLLDDGEVLDTATGCTTNISSAAYLRAKSEAHPFMPFISMSAFKTWHPSFNGSRTLVNESGETVRGEVVLYDEWAEVAVEAGTRKAAALAAESAVDNCHGERKEEGPIAFKASCVYCELECDGSHGGGVDGSSTRGAAVSDASADVRRCAVPALTAVETAAQQDNGTVGIPSTPTLHSAADGQQRQLAPDLGWAKLISRLMDSSRRLQCRYHSQPQLGDEAARTAIQLVLQKSGVSGRNTWGGTALHSRGQQSEWRNDGIYSMSLPACVRGSNDSQFLQEALTFAVGRNATGVSQSSVQFIGMWWLYCCSAAAATAAAPPPPLRQSCVTGVFYANHRRACISK
jgi:hypothetical protein